MSARGCRRRTTLPPLDAAYRQMMAVGRTVTELKYLAGKLKEVDAAPSLRKRLRYALSSAYGAHRHAVGVYLRAKEANP